MFKIFENKVDVQLDSKIKQHRTDKAVGYYDPSYFQEMDIVHKIKFEPTES